MSEYTQAKKQYKIEACADAVVDVLKELKSGRKYLPIKKYQLIDRATKRVAVEWKNDGYFHTVDNKRKIDCPDDKFIRFNWRHIREYCTEVKKNYISWNFDGIRLDNIKGYQENQKTLQRIASGAVKMHNRRAKIINTRGGQSEYLEVKQLLLPEASNDTSAQR